MKYEITEKPKTSKKHKFCPQECGSTASGIICLNEISQEQLAVLTDIHCEARNKKPKEMSKFPSEKTALLSGFKPQGVYCPRRNLSKHNLSQ